jgi:hypothetical protein
MALYSVCLVDGALGRKGLRGPLLVGLIFSASVFELRSRL